MSSRTSSQNVIPEYQRLQLQFANYIRDPERNSVPAGIEQRRMDIYKRLFFNNLESFCTKAFKLFRPFVDDTQWNGLIRDFMRKHPCTSPYFKDIPIAFVEYLGTSDLLIAKFPFIREMCHLDAMRMQLRLAPDATQSRDLDTKEQTTCLWLSPTVRLLSYEWPVHKLTPSTWNGKKPKQPTWLVAFRDRKDQVDVLVTNAYTFRMLEILEDARSLTVLSAQLSREYNVPQKALRKKLLPTIQALQKKGILLTVPSE